MRIIESFVFFLLLDQQYIKHAQTLFDSTHITVSAYTILSPEVQNQLREFSAKAKDFNTNANTHQVSVSHAACFMCVFLLTSSSLSDRLHVRRQFKRRN